MPDQPDTWPSTGCYEDIRLANSSCLCPPAVGHLSHGLVPLMPVHLPTWHRPDHRWPYASPGPWGGRDGWASRPQKCASSLHPQGQPGWQKDEFWPCVVCEDSWKASKKSPIPSILSHNTALSLLLESPPSRGWALEVPTPRPPKTGAKLPDRQSPPLNSNWHGGAWLYLIPA